MQLLPFNFHCLSNDKWLLTNSSGAFLTVQNRDLLESLIEMRFSELDSDLTQSLISKNFISQPNELGIRSSLLASRLSTQIAKSINPPSLFMIVPTLRCDHDCGYCQVSRVPLDKKGYDFDRNNIDKILNVIHQIAKGEIKIEFQGGEPLLAFDYIKTFYERAQDVLSGIHVSYVICTATGPLDSSIVEWVRDKNFSFSVSLDGPKEVHNFNRPSQYFDTYLSTVKSIDFVRSQLGMSSVSCITTISRHSLKYPIEIVNTYFEMGLPSIFLRPLSPFGFAAKTQRAIGYSVSEYIGFYKIALDHIVSLNEKNTFVEDTALIHLRRIFQPEESGYIDLQSPAGYFFGALVFNYDGNVFGSDEARMLWQSTKSPELVFGNIETPTFEWMKNSASVKILKSSFSCTSPGCEDCAFLPYCGADPMHHLATQGDDVGDKSLSFFCEYQKSIFDHIFTLWTSDEKSKKVFERWLSL